jgi:hypothetical protein
MIEATRTSNRQAIPILTYHQIADAPAKGVPFRSLYVSANRFRQQLGMLKALGYQGLSMRDLMPYLRGEKQGKVVGITLDDGYLNNHDAAMPAFARPWLHRDVLCGESIVGQKQCVGPWHWHRTCPVDGCRAHPGLDTSWLGNWSAYPSSRQFG